MNQTIFSVLILPPFLKLNDTICLLAPSGIVPPEAIGRGVEWAIQEGFNPAVGFHLTDNHYRFSATDEHRLHDFQTALNNPEIKAIWCVRGGYGMTRILDNIDWTTFSESPKWIIGFSDITALHLKLENLGFASIHGFMPIQFKHQEDFDEEVRKSTQALKKVLLGQDFELKSAPHSQNKIGKSHARITGGNLSLVINSIGTSNEIQTEGKILFLEEVGESLYATDRMLWQLKRTGKLDSLEGLVVGSFSESTQTKEQFGQSVEDMISLLTEDYDYPIAFGLPIGHTPQNEPIMMGSKVELSVDEQYASLSMKVKDNIEDKKLFGLF